MELSQLLQFKTVAECGKIKDAGERLFISSSAISQSIKKLEEELNAELFDHGNNSVTLNEKGRFLLANTNEIFKVVDKINNEFERAENLSEQMLNISSSIPSAIRYLLPHFNDAFPKILIVPVFSKENDLEHSLLNNMSDIAIGANRILNPEISSYPFMEECQMLSVPKGHPLYEKKNVSVKDLDGQAIVLHNIINNIYSEILNSYEKKYRIHIKYIVQSDYIFYRKILRTSDLLALSSNISLKYNDLYNRKAILFEEKDLRITYYISYAKKNLAKVNTFVKWLDQNYMKLLLGKKQEQETE